MDTITQSGCQRRLITLDVAPLRFATRVKPTIPRATQGRIVWSENELILSEKE